MVRRDDFVRRRRAGPALRALPVLTALVALPLLCACAAPAERGYYAPVVAPAVIDAASTGRASPGETAEGAGPAGLLPCRHELALAHFEVRCQGVYIDRVQGERRRTVHVQLQLARPVSGNLQLPREELSLEFRPPDSLIALRLLPAEVWSGRERIDGALVVPGWTRRAFDLFFEAPDLVDSAPPDALVFSLQAQALEGRVAQRCVFVRLAADDPRGPGEAVQVDRTFGLSRGYYLPGPADLGPRALRSGDEERLHHVFHAPRAGFWSAPWPAR